MKTLPLPQLLRYLNTWIFSCSNQFQLQTIEQKLKEIKESRADEIGWQGFEKSIKQSIRVVNISLLSDTLKIKPLHKEVSTWISGIVTEMYSHNTTHLKSPCYAQ